MTPLHDIIGSIETELKSLDSNGVWRIQLDLNKNEGFYKSMFKFDRKYTECQTLMGWNYKRDQLEFV
jgi:hypothetical protein